MTDYISRDALLKELMLDPIGRMLMKRYNLDGFIKAQPTVDAIPIDWIEEWCLSQDLEYVRIAIKKMMDNWKAERKEE